MGRFTQSEYEQRWGAVADVMRRKGHELAVVWGKTAGSYERALDLVYLTGFYSTQSGQEPDSPVWNARSFAAAILAPGEPPELHVDDASALDQRLATDRVSAHADVVAGVAAALKARRPATPVTFAGSDFFPVKYMRQLEHAWPDLVFDFDDDLVREVRRIKSPAELDCYREAGEVCTRALDTLMEGLTGGASLAAAAADAGHVMTRGGASWRRMIMNHGDQLERLEREPLTGLGDSAPAEGDLVRAWVDGVYEGYWLDPGRTAVCGRPTETQKRIIEATMTVCDRLRERIRPGVEVREIAELGDRLVAESGYGENRVQEAWPYYGHGLGCMWEPPLIEKRCTAPGETFEAGMVLGVECFLGDETLGVVGHEDNFIITAGGTEVITPAKRLWW